MIWSDHFLNIPSGHLPSVVHIGHLEKRPMAANSKRKLNFYDVGIDNFNYSRLDDVKMCLECHY